MTSNTTLNQCAPPFLLESSFPVTGGFVDGRFCSTLLGPSCCLPCPQTEWFYPDDFDTLTGSANWVNVGGLICCVFLLLSYAALPVAKTHRHYLSVCLTIGVIFMELGFIIPLGAKPDQCFNEITPNDMRSSRACALSGAFLLLGGWSGVMWIFMRSVALHLQICWEMVLGKTFMWGSLAIGWGVPAVGLTIALALSGVSFRFGDTCHINHDNSLACFWIPLLVFSGATLIIQFSTFGYCIKVYLESLTDESTTTNSSGLPSYAASARGTISPGQAYRRVRRVLELQWRGIVITLLIVTDVIFFAIVFVFLDDVESNLIKDPAKAKLWLGCLVQAGGQKNKCLNFAKDLTVSESIVMAVLFLLSVNGGWILILLGRASMFTGWYELLMGKVKPNNEFVSADAGRYMSNKEPGSYEMIGRNTDRTPEPTFSPVVMPNSTTSPLPPKNGRETPDFFGREARYKSPSRSFSAPKAPQLQSDGPQWDSTRTHAVPITNQYYSGMDPLSMNKT